MINVFKHQVRYDQKKNGKVYVDGHGFLEESEFTIVEDTREFKTADCCLNCSYRETRIDKNVICSLDHTWRSERLWCSSYKRTTNENILRGEQKLVPKED